MKHCSHSAASRSRFVVVMVLSTALLSLTAQRAFSQNEKQASPTQTVCAKPATATSPAKPTSFLEKHGGPAFARAQQAAGVPETTPAAVTKPTPTSTEPAPAGTKESAEQEQKQEVKVEAKPETKAKPEAKQEAPPQPEVKIEVKPEGKVTQKVEAATQPSTAVLTGTSSPAKAPADGELIRIRAADFQAATQSAAELGYEVGYKTGYDEGMALGKIRILSREEALEIGLKAAREAIERKKGKK